MQFAIGTDIISIERFNNNKDRHEVLLKKIFTKNELDYCFSKDTVEPHLAVRFAGKEAIIKALYSLNIEGVRYTDIEITNDKKGIPNVKIKENINCNCLVMKISLAHCENKAIAFAMIYRENPND